MVKIYGFTSEAQWEEFASQIQIVLLRYNPAYGIKLHIDNIARANSGPIATVSLGPPNVIYDLTQSPSTTKHTSIQ
jgi:alkylated DNA repair dioxygenase AlkB